jgi:hypothetical protein
MIYQINGVNISIRSGKHLIRSNDSRTRESSTYGSNRGSGKIISEINVSSTEAISSNYAGPSTGGGTEATSIAA